MLAPRSSVCVQVSFAAACIASPASAQRVCFEADRGPVVGENWITPATAADLSPSDMHVSVRGAVVTPGTRHYQVWYREAASYCLPAVLATTNVWSTTWAW